MTRDKERIAFLGELYGIVQMVSAAGGCDGEQLAQFWQDSGEHYPFMDGFREGWAWACKLARIGLIDLEKEADPGCLSTPTSTPA